MLLYESALINLRIKKILLYLAKKNKHFIYLYFKKILNIIFLKNMYLRPLCNRIPESSRLKLSSQPTLEHVSAVSRGYQFQ